MSRSPETADLSATALHRRILAGEVGVYLLLALAGIPAWGTERIIALVLLLACGVRGLIVGTTFVFARFHYTPPPRECRIDVMQWLAMFFREIGAMFILFTAIMPFERWFMREDRLVPRPEGRPPLLLIHGYLCNRGYWWKLRRDLEAAGWQVATISLHPAFGAVDGYVPQLARRIDDVRARTGGDRVIVIGHSMGGLVARAYLRSHGGKRLAGLVTLGSPHHGSRLAILGIGANARQMLPGSDWLAGFNTPCVLQPVPVAIYSGQDNFVMPQDSARLEGAKNVPVAGIGHLEMAFSPVIRRVLLDELEMLAANRTYSEL